MIALLIILGVLLLISLLPVGATAIYGESGALVFVKIGFIRLRVFPLKPKKPKKQREKKPKEKKEPEPEPEEKGGSVVGLKDILPIALKAGSRFKKSLTINQLTIHFTAAASDAFAAAMEYGAAWSAIGIIVPIFENNFKVRNRDLQANVDFTAEKPSVYAKATLTIHIWQAFYIGFGFGLDFLKAYRKGKKDNKESTLRKEAIK